jgi:acyl carrier protein
MYDTQPIKHFIVENFYVPDAATLRDDASLIESGIVDSTGVLEVIAFLERRYAIQVGDDEIVPENLDSVARIAEFVARKTASRAHDAPRP